MLKLDVTQLSIFFVTGIFHNDKDHKIFLHLFLSHFLANFCENILSVVRRNKKKKKKGKIHCRISITNTGQLINSLEYILKMVTDDYK